MEEVIFCLQKTLMVILKNNISGISVINEDEEYVYVKAGAGVNWHQFVMYCVEHQLWRS